MDGAVQKQSAAAGLLQRLYCHIPDPLSDRDRQDDDGFRAFWDNLVEDDKYKHYTRRSRRVLRYFVQPDGQLTSNPDLVIYPRVKRDIKGAERPNPLSPAPEGFADHRILKGLLAENLAMVPSSDNVRELDIHLFRVEADAGKSSPTTSGIHQDGAEWVFMHFINAKGANPVFSRVFDKPDATEPLFEIVLGTFLETLVLDDTSLWHQADPVVASGPNIQGVRDMLIMTLSTQLLEGPNVVRD